MKNMVRRALTAACMVVSVLAAASPAGAANCEGLVQTPVRTIGVGGNDLLTTPDIRVGSCGDTNVGLPTPRVERYPSSPEDMAIFLDFPEAPSGSPWVVGVTVDGTYREVVIPTNPGGGASSICVLFQGPYYYNPGGCLAYLER